MHYKDLFYALSLFLICIKLNHILPTAKQSKADDTLLFITKTLPGELIPALKANLNEHPSIFHSIQYFFMENQRLLPAEILSEWKIEFILPYIMRNFQISRRSKLTVKCLLPFSHYARSHSDYGRWVYVKNKVGSHIYSLVYKFNVRFIRLENLVYQNNPCIIYTIGQSSIQHTTINQLNITWRYF